MPRSGLAILALILLAGCGLEGRTAEWNVMHAVEVRDEGNVVATWTLWGGWDEENLPVVPPPEGIAPGPPKTFAIAAYNLNGEVIPLLGAPDHAIGYRLSAGEPTGILDLDRPSLELSEGGEVHLFGATPGNTRIEFTLYHEGTLRQATLPISVTVGE